MTLRKQLLCAFVINFRAIECVMAEVEFCPQFCACNFYNGLNYANCSSQRLISAEIEVPTIVEVLDLSYNDVINLQSNCFEHFVHLQNLNLSHNSLYTIYWNAFNTLRRLSYVDLSHNRLEYIDERIFETNLRLLSLNLSYNKFMSLSATQPLLRNDALQILNLRHTQLTQLASRLFSALPNLVGIDVSENLLITLNAAAFAVLPLLQNLSLSANRWKCDDQDLRLALRQLRRRDIQVELDECAAPSSISIANYVTFERLQMSPTKTKQHNVNVNANANRWRQPQTMSPMHCSSVWQELCRRCKGKNDKEVGEKEEYGGGEEEGEENRGDEERHKVVDAHNVRRYTLSDLELVFLVGNALGVTFVVCIISCALCCKRSCELRRKRNSANNNQTTLVAPPASLQPPQPPPPSQRRRRNATRQRISHSRAHINCRPALMQRDFDAHQLRGDNFLSRLFGLPARHNYYRRINQNTSTLVHNLSRNNLFASRRLSQYESATEFVNGGEGQRECRGANRSETPPPSYGDAVINILK